MENIYKNIQKFIFTILQRKYVSDNSEGHTRVHTGEKLSKYYITGEKGTKNSKLYYLVEVHGGEVYI